MDYNTLLNKLPAETELHHVNDCSQFFIENKLDILITLLTKEVNNDKTRLKPIQGNDSGV